MRRLFKKGRVRRGFSLAETLTAVLVLSIMTSMASLGVTQALQRRNESVKLADAQTVAATAAEVITDQIRYGQIIGVDTDGAILLASGTYNAPISMGLADGRLSIQGVSPGEGGAIVRSGSFTPLGEKAYSGLEVRDLSFTLHQSGETVSAVDVAFSVDDGDPSNTLWELEFSVSPVNPTVYTL